jgi:hypothetical protein
MWVAECKPRVIIEAEKVMWASFSRILARDSKVDVGSELTEMSKKVSDILSDTSDDEKAWFNECKTLFYCLTCNLRTGPSSVDSAPSRSRFY